jgi:hypothetical protein
MLLTDFYKLAKQNDACDLGLIYLKGWMANHPTKKNVVDFLKSQRNVRGNGAAFTPHGYLRWIFRNLLDWSELNDMDYLALHDQHNTKETNDFIMKLFGTCDLTEVSAKRLTTALIRAFS